jgi:hypothetical protein
MASAYVQAAAPETNAGASRQLKVGRRGRDQYRSFLRFRLPAIGSASLTAAKVMVLQEARHGGSRPLTIDLYGVRSPWREAEVDWANRPSSDGAPTASVPTPPKPAWMEFNIDVLAAAWLAQSRANWGPFTSTDEDATALTFDMASRSTSPGKAGTIRVIIQGIT